MQATQKHGDGIKKEAYMYRVSNSVIGLLNILSLVGSIPIMGGGLWLGRSSRSCESFLETPVMVVGLVVLMVSVAGFIGAWLDVGWALWVYLAAMLFLIASLTGLTVAGFVVTSPGGGVAVPGKMYEEYLLEGYSPWLRSRVSDPRCWARLRTCIVGSNTCAELADWTPLDYLQRDMSPIQSGCCKPPTACNYDAGTAQEQDCYRWNNAGTTLCYDCDSCKASLLETLRRDWHNLSLLNVIMLVLLIAIYSIACCAFQNTKRAQTHYPYAHNRMSKHWWRWWHDRRDQLY